MSGSGLITFLPSDDDARRCARRLVVTSLAANGLTIDEWRAVRDDRPCELAIVVRPPHLDEREFEQRLRTARQETAERGNAYRLAGFVVESMT
ncbi:MAG TPA: hypothetical protein VLU46_09105 [Thermoanaerobaculia bacterium]|nr:hypothetical protein [Thermoanaerobaculia bacterium]